MRRPAFTVGIEEEYYIVDRETRDLVRDMPPGLLEECEAQLGPQVSPEFLRSQIEVGTKVCANLQEAREDLAFLRRTVGDTATKYGLAIISASTHPFAQWEDQQHTDKERYNMLAEAMQGVVRQLLICGMHVHVGIEDEDLRIDLMNQTLYFLPHLLALSSSSPFWRGVDTGLNSYRTTVFRTLPRTGLPDEFSGWAEYQRHVAALVNTGVIEDATKMWWDLRPSARYPTLEMRSTDICTRLDDGITIAALYMSFLGMLFNQREKNKRWRIYSRMLIEENIWRAQRYGISDSLIDFGKGKLVPYAELLEEALEMLHVAATELGLLAELGHARDIVARGTSADRQREVFSKKVAEGATERQALVAVVDFLIEETMVGV